MNNKIYINKEDFYNRTRIFFEEGLMNEIYSSEKISICNVANALYLVFNYTVSNLGAIGIHLEPKYIEGMINDNDLFYDLCNSLGKEKLSNESFCMDYKMFNYLKSVKEKTDLLGPYVNLEYEKSITGNLKSR